MLKYPLVICLLFSITSRSQSQIPYVDSKELLTKGIEFYDKGEYKKSVEQYRQIHECDTNYALSRYEMGLSLTADTAYEEAKAVILDALKLHYGNKRGLLL